MVKNRAIPEHALMIAAYLYQNEHCTWDDVAERLYSEYNFKRWLGFCIRRKCKSLGLVGKGSYCPSCKDYSETRKKNELCDSCKSKGYEYPAAKSKREKCKTRHDGNSVSDLACELARKKW